MRVLVTGGGGFLGQAVIRQLVACGDRVTSLQRSDTPNLVTMGVECVRGDVADLATVERAATGCEIIFHIAAKAGVWGTYDEFYRANVVGTENVISACLSQEISKLVYTSSPSVVFDGRNEQGIDESTPYPKKYLAHYPKTKAIAERLVLAANGSSLATVSLRPHLIWGPGDNHLFPRLIQRARQGRLCRIGDGKNLVDTVYVENAADAHIMVSNELAKGSKVAGKAYFISNGEPVPLWELIDRLLACAKLPPVKRHISATTAFLMGALLEFVFRVTGCRNEPPMTRFVARQLSTAHWFCLDAARRDFGYQPRVSIEEGLQRLTDSLSGNRLP